MAKKNSVLLEALRNRIISSGLTISYLCERSGLSRSVVDKILIKGWFAKYNTLNTLRMHLFIAKIKCDELDKIISAYEDKEDLIELIKGTNFSFKEINQLKNIIKSMIKDNDNDA